jgi:phosphoglycerate dehydrogenase-like enzyme
MATPPAEAAGMSGAGTRLLVVSPAPEEAIEPIRARFPALDLADCRDVAELARIVGRHRPEVAFVSRHPQVPFPREALLAAPTLRWVASAGVGVDFLLPWDKDRLVVTNSRGVTAGAIAQFAIGAIIAFASRILVYHRQQLAREWRQHPVERIAGKTLVLVGLGHIGEAIAKRALAFDMRVVGVRARPRPSATVQRVFGPDRLLEALAEGDAVAASLPLTRETRGLFDARAFAAMKPGSLFVSLGRGQSVDEAALVQALRAGPLGGAVLDVFETEPLPAASPLWGLDNVLVTPHCISDYAGWQRDSAAMFADNLANWLAGRPLFNVVDPERGY